ncbi:hypothetical protein [Saccharopolyspora gregorii]|uniref:Exonuclease domain-containing protein n=1 Tax=Saccharopolyspora gregorii TaxID=33914 RepID=A0ABP6S2T6_9PSEU
MTGPVVDPRCLDKRFDRYRKGKRTLGALCEHYRVRLDSAHDATADALACARLAWRLAKTHPDEIGTRALAALHEDQTGWHRDQQHDSPGSSTARPTAPPTPPKPTGCGPARPTCAPAPSTGRWRWSPNRPDGEWGNGCGARSSRPVGFPSSGPPGSGALLR